MKKKYLYTSRHMYIHNKEVVLSRHAVIQAEKRNIFADEIEATIKGGNIERFGKKFYRFCKKYKRRTIICIGEQIDGVIIIKTVCKKIRT